MINNIDRSLGQSIVMDENNSEKLSKIKRQIDWIKKYNYFNI